MNTSKIDYLIDELGKIDDRFVDEAMKPQVPVRSKGNTSRALALVAAVVMTLVLSMFFIASLNDESFDNENAFDENSPAQTEKDAIYTDLASLDAQLFEAAKVDSDMQVLLYSETPRFIWTFGDGVYYSVTIRNSVDKKIIDEYLKNDQSITAYPNEQFTDFRFWITYGNGKCTTPYLENNGGRYFYGTISDYLPEIYPSDAFAKFICDLIREQL